MSLDYSSINPNDSRNHTDMFGVDWKFIAESSFGSIGKVPVFAGNGYLLQPVTDPLAILRRYDAVLEDRALDSLEVIAALLLKYSDIKDESPRYPWFTAQKWGTTIREYSWGNGDVKMEIITGGVSRDSTYVGNSYSVVRLKDQWRAIEEFEEFMSLRMPLKSSIQDHVAFIRAMTECVRREFTVESIYRSGWKAFNTPIDGNFESVGIRYVILPKTNPGQRFLFGMPVPGLVVKPPTKPIFDQ